MNDNSTENKIEESLKELEKLLIGNKLELFFKKIEDDSFLNAFLWKDVMMQKIILVRIVKDNRDGLLDYDQYNSAINRVCKALMEILQAFRANNISHIESTSSRNRKLEFSVFILLLSFIAVLILFFIFPKNIGTDDMGLSDRETKLQEQTDKGISQKNIDKETDRIEKADFVEESTPSQNRKASIKIENFPYRIKKKNYVIDVLSGERILMESSMLQILLPLEQKYVSLKIMDELGQEYGTLNAICCDNLLKIKYNEK